MPTSNTIFVVDPDRSSVSVVRAAARSIDVDCVSFRSAEQFLDSRRSPRIGCVVAEMQLPGLSGLELQESLIAKNSSLPMIFVTAYAKTSRTVLAMRGGAVTVLDKVPTAAELADAFHQALSRSKTLHRIDSQHSHVRRRMARLSAQERQVLDFMVDGKTNAWIADRMGVSLRTVESRRHKVFHKMKTDSIARLIKMIVSVQRRL